MDKQIWCEFLQWYTLFITVEVLFFTGLFVFEAHVKKTKEYRARRRAIRKEMRKLKRESRKARRESRRARAVLTSLSRGII